MSTPARIEPSQAVAMILRRYEPVVGRLLAGTGTSADTFVAQVANACRATPKLWECQPETVLGVALRCAQLALPPNDGNSLAWIIPYGKVATFQLGYGGVMELARRAAPGLQFEGHPVYPNDLFQVERGTEPKLRHVPHVARKRNRGGDAVAWYVIATYPDGRIVPHWLDREGVEYHRRFSKQPDGEMWSKSYDAAALKSVVLDMRRWLPNSRQLAEAIASDGTTYDVREMGEDGPSTTVDSGPPSINERADSLIDEPELDPGRPFDEP